MNRTIAALAAGGIALGGLFWGACGDGADPVPTPTPTHRAVTLAPSATKAAGSPAAEGTAITLENPTVLPSGLKYTDQVVGTGASPRADQSVTVHYTGKLAANGKKFDSSVDRGQPATFPMNGVIKGFSEGLSTMKVGGKRTVFIPSALGYGARGAGADIPPNSDLIFELELIAIK